MAARVLFWAVLIDDVLEVRAIECELRHDPVAPDVEIDSRLVQLEELRFRLTV